jgi:hypothetical protein
VRSNSPETGPGSPSSTPHIDDTSFVVLSCEELIKAAKLILSHLRLFGQTSENLTRRTLDFSTMTIAVSLSFCEKFKYLEPALQRVSATHRILPSESSVKKGKHSTS